VQKIRCEAKAAVEEHGRGFANASIVYSFTFNINEHNDASAGLTLFDPFKTGTVNLTGSAGSNRTRDGFRNFELIDSFDDLRKLSCTRDREKNWVYPLTGDVGMYEAVATFIRLQKADDPGGTRIFTFADTLTYTTTFTGGVNATLTLSPVSNQFRVTAANAGVSGSRTDTHKVVVTMAAGHQTIVDHSTGRRTTRRTVPTTDTPIARSGGGRNGNGPPVYGNNSGQFNTILSTRMLQQDSSAENRALYEQDRQRQLELQRQSQDVRVLVGP